MAAFGRSYGDILRVDHYESTAGVAAPSPNCRNIAISLIDPDS